MINKITKDMFPNDWTSFTDDYYERTNEEHRRGSSFYVNYIYKLDEENAKDFPQLWGMWESDTVIHDSEYGCDDTIDTLYRVNKVKRTIVQEFWERVKDETVDSR